MAEAKRIESISMDRLVAHPCSCNRMSRSRFRKLVGHIRVSGNYEPVIVRRHSRHSGCYEIVNGHHRMQALRQLGTERVDCVVWDVDDDETAVLLGTLNRLEGRDDVDMRSRLVKALSEKHDSRSLAKLLPETRKSIERLRDLSGTRPRAKTKAKAMLNPIVFFVSDEQKSLVEGALKEALDPADTAATNAQRKVWSLVRIAESFLEGGTEQHSDNTNRF